MLVPVLVMILTGFAALSLVIPAWAAGSTVLGATLALATALHIRSRFLARDPRAQPRTRAQTVVAPVAPVVSPDPTL